KDGRYTIDVGDSNPITIDTNASAIIFDGVASGITSTNVQDVIVEINTKLDGTTDILVDNGNGTFTHTTAGGTELTFSANTTNVAEIDGVYTFSDGTGVIATIDTNVSADTVVFDAGESGLASANVQDAIVEINTKLDGTTDILVDNGNGTFTHTTADGTELTFDANTIKISEADGVYTFKNPKDEVITTIDSNVRADVVSFENNLNGFSSDNVQDAIEEIQIKLDGTTDSLIDNENGTFTHTTAGGTELTFSANTTKVEEIGGVYTFSDGTGVIATIDSN